MEKKSAHDRIASRLANKFKTRHRRTGVDLRVKDKAIEVAASSSDLYQSMRQLRASRKPKKYLAVPPSYVPRARSLTKGTGIGVMTPSGKIRKRSRKRS